MSQFQDKTGQAWDVNLDPVIALEIKDDHGIELTNLQSDPMLKLRIDPMVLVSTMSVICRDQMQERNLSPTDFMKLLPMSAEHPSDEMLAAVQEAIVSFFPTGRASHVAEVLAGFVKMGEETDALTTEKMRALLNDPATRQRISEVADLQIKEAMQNLSQTSLQPGTSNTEVVTAST